MSFTAPRFTDEGKALQAKAQAGTALKFTKMQLGDGELGSQAIAAMTKLVNPLITVGISSVKAGSNYATVKSNFSNSGLTTGFYWREIGVFAADPEKPNDRNSDILYCYANAGSLAEYIPAAGSEIVEKIISIPCIIGDAENVSAEVESGIYATKEELNEHINDKNNPHRVTAKQIGALTNDSLTKETILNKINVLDIAHGGTGAGTASEALENLGGLPKTDYTAADILEKLKTVDGSGSGLDADKFKGNNIIPVENGGTGKSTIQEVNNAFEWSNPNLLINGDFQVWQRGDSFTGTGKIFTADRWFIPLINNDSGNKVEKVKNTSDCPSMYAMRLTRQNTSGKVQIYQPIENYSMYEGKKLTISFYVRAVGTPKFIGYRIGQNQNGGITPTTSWQRVLKTVEAAHFTTDVSCGGFLIYTTDDGLFAANSGIEITGLKVELGGVATPFTSRTYQEELALCQRYFYNPLYIAGGYPYLTELCTTTNGGAFRIQFPVPMRILPTLSGDFGNLYIKNNSGSTTAITAIKRGDGTNVAVSAVATTAGTFTANQFYYLQHRGTSPNYTSILFDAEIY